jgi:impB/mucB/samB family C-terminal domain
VSIDVVFRGSGKLLTLLARGEDILPFQPTPAPLRLHYRLRLRGPITSDRLLIGLTRFGGEVAMALARRSAQARTIEVRLRWEHGELDRVTRTLIQSIAESRALTETMARLLSPLLEAHSALPPSPMVEDLRLILSDLSPRYPEQHAFWPQRAQRLTAAREISEVLVRRHGKPLLFHRLLTSPDAIFEQNRSRQVPLEADVAETPASGAAWPQADVLSEGIPHGTHWW